MKAENIKKALKGATKRYTAMRKKEERGHRVVRNSYMYIPSDRVTVREVAFEVMEDAYMKASGNGKYPANVRQVMYAARPAILAQGTKDKFTTAYFTQTLLPAYIEEHDPDWAENVAYDARGHFAEPHLPDFHRERHELGLGTLEVREYLHGIGDNAPEWVTTSHLSMRFPTRGPCNRFGAMLFIEKEGFMPLFETIDLANRFDIAIMSTKGQSVTACRHLVDQICSEYDIPLVVLHDFDKAGFSILGGFQRNTKRYTWMNEVTVHDIAVRLNDVQEYSIDPEPCRYKGNSAKVKKNLRLNGATEEEIKFLITEDGWGWTPGQRVELNAYVSSARNPHS